MLGHILGTQSWLYCLMGKMVTPKSLIHVPQNIFTAAKCIHIELSFHVNHYNNVVPIEGVMPPPVIIV